MKYLLTIIGFSLSIYGIKVDKGYISGIGGGFILIAVILFIFYIKTGHISKNDNDKTWIKPEKSATPKYLPKGKKANNIDGLATQKGIFKIPNATSVKIDNEGNIKFTTEGKIFNKILNLKGGYQNNNFATENPNWKPLADKQKELI